MEKSFDENIEEGNENFSDISEEGKEEDKEQQQENNQNSEEYESQDDSYYNEGLEEELINSNLNNHEFKNHSNCIKNIKSYS